MSSASRLERPLPTAQAHVVLVVEDEPVLRASIVRGLSKLSGVEVVDAGSVRDAIELSRVYPPTLVISDLDLPDGSGVELAAALERQGRSLSIVFLTAYLSRFRARLPNRPGVEVHEKPMPLERLRQVVVSRLGAAESDAHPFGVLDYVQLAGMGRRSVVLDVRGHLHGVGTIVVRRGELWSASDELGRGIEAFKRLVFLANATVSLRAATEISGERDIEGGVESVLLEVAREHDEAVRDASSWRPPPARHGLSSAPPAVRGELSDDALEAGWDQLAPPIAPSRIAPREPPPPTFEELYERGVDALLAKRHGEAYGHFLAASHLRPSDASVIANLNRLRIMGHGT